MIPSAGWETTMTAVSDIMILDPSSTPYVYPPDPRYTRIAVDLNQGAGGKYIFAAYLRDEGTPIRGLFVSVQSDAEPHVPPGFTVLNVDLNQGAGGSYVYLCYTRDTDAGDPVNDLTVVAGDNEDPPLPDGWKLVPGDLNAGAGGAYVYFIYR
ncbi:hypothetical protein GCM10009558_079690 [Virgisporangium aurantiacum]